MLNISPKVIKARHVRIHVTHKIQLHEIPEWEFELLKAAGREPKSRFREVSIAIERIQPSRKPMEPATALTEKQLRRSMRLRA